MLFGDPFGSEGPFPKVFGGNGATTSEVVADVGDDLRFCFRGGGKMSTSSRLTTALAAAFLASFLVLPVPLPSMPSKSQAQTNVFLWTGPYSSS